VISIYVGTTQVRRRPEAGFAGREAYPVARS
jgi:hypothetical protein